MKRDLDKARAFQRSRRKGLGRGKAMKPGPAPERKKQMPQENRKRRKARLEVAFGPQADLCRGLPCCAMHPELYTEDMLALEHYTAAWRVSTPHHSPTVKTGGLDKDTSPVNDRVHDRIHKVGEATVEREMGLPQGHFRRVAARLHHELRGNR